MQEEREKEREQKEKHLHTIQMQNETNAWNWHVLQAFNESCISVKRPTKTSLEQIQRERERDVYRSRKWNALKSVARVHSINESNNKQHEQQKH